MNVREALDQPRTTLEAAPEAVVSPRKRAVLILGVHRSGTSAVTRVVNLLGAALPTRLMPAAADNEAGFWESADLMEIHEAALASAGATWQEVSAVPRTWFESDAAREFRDRLVAVLRHDFQQCGMFVIKDPRMCLLAPLWRQALAAFDAEPCYVIPVRNPLEVAASLKKRDALPFARSLLLWVTNFIEAETETRGAARAIVRYEQLLNDWRPVARAMERDLRLVWPRRSLAAEAEIDAFLSNRLRHHEYRLDDLLIRPELGGWVKRLYVAALNAQANGQPLSTAVDAVSAEVREAHLAFGPLLAEAERDLRATREHAAHLTRTLAAHENTAATRAADDDARRREEAARERAAAAEQERDRALAERDAALSTRAAALAARDAAAQEREAALYSRDQERERARTETERLTAALAASEASLAASASEVARLALALREAEAAATAWDKESAARLEALDAERARLDAALAAKAHEAADMAGRLATARADLHKTRTRTQTFLTHAETLREKVARAEQATRERDQALAAAAARERALELTLDGERRAHEADAAQSRTEIDEQQNRAAGLRADIESLARELRSPLLRAARRLRDGWFRLKGWVAGRYPAPAVATLGLEPWPLRGPGWRRETTEGGPGAEVRLEGAFDAGWTVIGFTAQADGPCAVEIAVDEAGSEARWEGGALGAKMAWRQYAIRLGAATQAIAIRFVGHPGALLFTNEVVRRDGWWTRRLLARSDEGRALVARGSLSAWAAAALLPGASRACLLAFAPRELVAGETVAPPDVGSAPVRASSVGPPDVGSAPVRASSVGPPDVGSAPVRASSVGPPDGGTTNLPVADAPRSSPAAAVVEAPVPPGRWDLVTPELRPAGDAQPGGDERFPWRSVGEDPRLAAAGPFPAGWVRLRAEVAAEPASIAVVYVDAGAGPREEEAITLGRVDREVEAFERVVFLPEGVRVLRLDPMTEPGRFSVPWFSLEALPDDEAEEAALRELADFAPYSSLGAEELLGPARAARAAGDAAALHAALRAAVAATEIDRRTPYVVFQRQRAKEIPSREEAERAVASWGEAPLISILFPVYNCPEEYLDAALRSVRAQVYPRWQLCVADDASTHPHVRRVLERHAHEEPRVEIAWRRENGNISAASNTALEMARGEYAALLDNDDLLEPDALLEMARAARAHADTDMLYSDEDKIDEAGRRYLPFFKPDWSPDYFLSCMYTCHLAMFRTGLVREVGGFRSRYDGAQDWDLALRVSRRARRVVHVPRVLYHWRAHPGSMARDIDGKPYSHFAAQDALKDFLAGGAHPGRVDNGPLPCMFHVRYEIAGSPLVSIVVPTAGAARAVRGKPVCLVANLVARLLNVTAYQRYEVIIVATAALSAETRAALADERVRVIDAREPSFNFARAVNRGAAEARGDHLLFLNDDTEPINGDWLGGMLEFSQQPAVGAVGAKLLFESGALQHAGVTLQNGLPGHPFRGAPASAPGHFNSIVAPRNYSAVTGACLMTRRDLFNRLGGFDEGFPLNYNDIDYCLKARAAGLRVVYTPYATLYHFEGQSRAEQSPADWERGLFLSRWGQQYLVDPFFNPNLDPRFGDFRMRI